MFFRSLPSQRRARLTWSGGLSPSGVRPQTHSVWQGARHGRADYSARSMIRKTDYRFSEKIMGPDMRLVGERVRAAPGLQRRMRRYLFAAKICSDGPTA